MVIKHKSLPVSIKQKDGNALEFTISTNVQDRDTDILEPTGCKLDNYLKNPVVLFAHDYKSLPIGRSKSVSVTPDAVVAEVEFAPTQFAQEVRQLCEAGFLKAASVGFIPLKYEPIGDSSFGHRIYEWELLEWSIVPVPSNPTALISEAKAKGMQVTAIEEVLKKGVISYGQAHPDGTPKAPEDAEWDGPKEVAAADVEDLKVMCAWVDSENAENKGAYKLPHHRASDHYLVWSGVRAAMGALLGARGGVDIPEGDKKGVYNHLAKHYEDFGKEHPEFREYTEAEWKELEQKWGLADEKPKNLQLVINTKEERLIVLDENGKEIGDIVVTDLLKGWIFSQPAVVDINEKAGAVLSKKNKERLAQAQALIQEVLDSSEPAPEEDSSDKGKEKVLDMITDEGAHQVDFIDLDSIETTISADGLELNIEPDALKALLKETVKEELDRACGKVS